MALLLAAGGWGLARARLAGSWAVVADGGRDQDTAAVADPPLPVWLTRPVYVDAKSTATRTDPGTPRPTALVVAGRARVDPAPATDSVRPMWEVAHGSHVDGRADPAPAAMPPAPPAAEPVPPPSPPHDPITLAVTGDILAHARVNERAASLARGDGFDYAPLFAPVRRILEQADLSLCHLEVPIAPEGEGITAYPSFGAPAALVDGIAAAGYDGCSLASNHSLDRGVDGVTTTLDQFDRLGLGHAGTARSQAEAATTTVYDVDGVAVAHLSYSYGFNGHTVPANAPWVTNTIDPDGIAADARRAARAADVVVVSLHWGTEYQHEPSTEQRRLVDTLLPSDDIDLVVGHHAHVVQPIEFVAGTWVVFGLGNHLSNQVAAEERDGLLALVRFTARDDGRWEADRVQGVPTWVDLDSHRVLPATRRGADEASDALRAELAASHARTAEVLGDVLGGDHVDGLGLAPAP